MNPFKPNPDRREINEPACDADERAQLERFAVRPPAGLVLCKFGSRSVVGRIDVGGKPAVLKYYYPRNALKRLTYGLFGSRARRSWQTGLELMRLGILTAEPLALFEWKSCGGLLLDRSFLGARHVSGVDLQTFVERHSGDGAWLAAVSANLKKTFALMARHRVAHGDLKASNIIVGEDHSVTFIDLDATVINASPKRWPALRKRDATLFFANWKGLPLAAGAFRDVFDSAA